jgi:hypothetical protein
MVTLIVIYSLCSSSLLIINKVCWMCDPEHLKLHCCNPLLVSQQWHSRS